MKISCPYCGPCAQSRSNSESPRIVAKGFFKRRCDRRLIQRYHCSVCKRGFSSATSDPFYRSRTRHFNQSIYVAFCSTNSQRRIARTIGLARGTVARKLEVLGQLSEARMDAENRKQSILAHCQFDDLETHEHTKLKPLSVTVAVATNRCILALAVSKMHARGLVAVKSRAKYGAIRDQRDQGRASVFAKLQPLLSPTATIASDQNPHYPPDLKKAFPFAHHQAFKGRDGRSDGQGELKKGGFDPLFALNHTCAMLRANTNRLLRRTWCTTKKAACLSLHLHIFADYHNEWIRKKRPPEFPKLRKVFGGGLKCN